MTLLEDAPERYAAFTPENFDRGFLGPVFARDALIHSRNVPAVRLLADLGVERFRDLLDRLASRDCDPPASMGWPWPLAAVGCRSVPPPGDLPGPHCPRTTPSWFVPGVSRIKVSTVYRAVAVDRETGLRSCRADAGTVRRVYEFWPSNLRAVIRRAGIAVRQPPPWSPECGLDEASASGLAPRIRSPQRALVYHAASPGAERANVLFSAVADGDARELYWFVDDRLVATAAPGEGLFWTPRVGRFTVRVVDDLGRADAVPLRVAAAPANRSG